MNDPIKFEVTPTRVGRHTDIEPFTVALGSHHQATEKMLGARIMKRVGMHLMRDNTKIKVNLASGKWVLNDGRSGSGTVREVD